MYGRPFKQRRRRSPKKWVHPAVRLQKARIAAAKRAHKKALRAAGILPPIRRRKPRRRPMFSRSMTLPREGFDRFSIAARSRVRKRAMGRAAGPLGGPLGGRSLGGPLGSKRSYPFASLRSVEKYLPMAKAWDVSAVARGPGGFVAAFKRAKGKPSKLSAAWKAKRNAFIRRHVAEAKARGEKLTLKKGHMTRRSLALAMWAYKFR